MQIASVVLVPDARGACERQKMRCNAAFANVERAELTVLETAMKNHQGTVPPIWRIDATREIYDNGFFRLRYDECALAGSPSVKENLYIIECPDIITVVPLTADGKIVLVDQYRHAVDKRVLEFPGGTFKEADRNFEGAAARELREEAGYHSSAFAYLGHHPLNPSGQTTMVHTYIALNCTLVGAQKLDDFEDIDVVLKDPAELCRSPLDMVRFQMSALASLMLAVSSGYIRTASDGLRDAGKEITSCARAGGASKHR